VPGKNLFDPGNSLYVKFKVQLATFYNDGDNCVYPTDANDPKSVSVTTAWGAAVWRMGCSSVSLWSPSVVTVNSNFYMLLL
jgi:hypothetical protein